MTNEERYKDLKADIEDLDLVDDAHIGDEYLYIESVKNCSTLSFRGDVSSFLLEREGEYSLELRTKENTDGLVGIVGDEVEHPVQKATMYCGVLDLSDRYTYQIQLKATDLTDDGTYDGENPEAFALAVVQVLSTAFDFGPYDPDELSTQFDVSKGELADYVSDIMDSLGE